MVVRTLSKPKNIRFGQECLTAGMSEICERHQINDKISYGMVQNLERTEQNQNVKSQN
jgi:hypothetical protein